MHVIGCAGKKLAESIAGADPLRCYVELKLHFFFVVINDKIEEK